MFIDVLLMLALLSCDVGGNLSLAGDSESRACREIRHPSTATVRTEERFGALPPIFDLFGGALIYRTQSDFH